MEVAKAHQQFVQKSKSVNVSSPLLFHRLHRCLTGFLFVLTAISIIDLQKKREPVIKSEFNILKVLKCLEIYS